MRFNVCIGPAEKRGETARIGATHEEDRAREVPAVMPDVMCPKQRQGGQKGSMQGGRYAKRPCELARYIRLILHYGQKDT